MAAQRDGSPVSPVSPAVPTMAGVYDALLGFKDNYAADREAVAAALEVTPLVRDAARNNRAFLARAVTWAAGQGIRQFLDLGCGYSPLTHGAAGEGARVAYVDIDPVVVSHARALLAGPGITAHQADLRDADGILRECRDDGWDLAEPVCAILGLVLQYFPADEAREVTGRYISRLAPGSAVIVSAWATADDELAARLGQTHPADLHRHSALDVASFLGGTELVEPGVTWARAWRAGWKHERVRDTEVHVLSAVGVIPR